MRPSTAARITNLRTTPVIFVFGENSLTNTQCKYLLSCESDMDDVIISRLPWLLPLFRLLSCLLASHLRFDIELGGGYG